MIVVVIINTVNSQLNAKQINPHNLFFSNFHIFMGVWKNYFIQKADVQFTQNLYLMLEHMYN